LLFLVPEERLELSRAQGPLDFNCKELSEILVKTMSSKKDQELNHTVLGEKTSTSCFQRKKIMGVKKD